MPLRFKDEPVEAAFSDLLVLAARRGCSASVVVEAGRALPGGAARFASLVMPDNQGPTVREIGEVPTGAHSVVVRFPLTMEVVAAILLMADGPLGLYGRGLPENLTIFVRNGSRWFWSDGSDETCGSDVDQSAWARDVAGSTALSRIRVTPTLDNLFDAGGAEELVGDLAYPDDRDGDGDPQRLRVALLLDEVQQGFRNQTPDLVLRSLGAAALVLDSRADLLGSIVWRRTRMDRDRVAIDDLVTSRAEQTLRDGLASAQWRDVWPEVAGREAVQSELVRLLGM